MEDYRAAADTLQGQVQQSAEAEADGFDSFWTAQVAGVDALTLLALSGDATQTIEMGTAVVPTYPRHPMALAQQALTTQAATRGRLLLGIGLSHRPVVEDRWGMSFHAPAQHMDEYLTVLQSLMHMAGSRADGTITWMVGPRTLDTHIVPRINSAAEGAGRPAPRVCVGLPICVTDDSQTGFEAASEHFGRYGGLPSYRRMLDIEGVESPAEVAIIGDEAEVEARLRALSSAGATDFLASIFPVGDDADGSAARTREFLKSLAERV